MKEKQVKLPGPDHPISIQHSSARVVVSIAGRVVADTRNALTLCDEIGELLRHQSPNITALYAPQD